MKNRLLILAIITLCAECTFFSTSIHAQSRITICAVDDSTNAVIPDVIVQVRENDFPTGLQKTGDDGCAQFDVAATSVGNDSDPRRDDFYVQAPFPNPAIDVVSVNVRSNAQDIQLEMYDMLGRRVIADVAKRDGPATQFRVSLDRVPMGVYFLRIMSGGRTEVVQIVKAGINSSPSRRGGVISNVLQSRQTTHFSNKSESSPSSNLISVRMAMEVDSLTADSSFFNTYYGAHTSFSAGGDTTVVMPLKKVARVSCDNAEFDGEEAPEIFIIVEFMPELQGGLSSLQAHLAYSSEAKAAGIEGRVFVQLIVDKTGGVFATNIVRGIGFGLDEDALLVVATEARFTPGLQRGEPQCVRMSLPLTYKL